MSIFECIPKYVRDNITCMGFAELSNYIESLKFIDDFRVVGKYCGCGLLQYHNLVYCSKCGSRFTYTNQSISDFYRCHLSEQSLLSIFGAIVESELFSKFVRPTFGGAVNGSLVAYFKNTNWTIIEKSLRGLITCDQRNLIG